MAIKKRGTDRSKKSRKSGVGKVRIGAKSTARVEPDNWYTAVFEEAETGGGQYGDYIMLHFTLKGGYFEDSEKSASGWKKAAFVNLNEDGEVPVGSKGAKFLETIVGDSAEEDEELDLTPYYGNKYKVFVEDTTNKRTKEVKQNITKIKPYTAKKKRRG